MKTSERNFVLDSMVSIADNILKEAETLCELIDSVGDADSIAKRIGIIENDADLKMNQLNFYFRENHLSIDEEASMLMNLARNLERCSDAVANLASAFVRFNITELRNDVDVSIMNAVSAGKLVIELVLLLKETDKLNSPYKIIVEISHYKDESIAIFNSCISKLFSGDEEIIDVIRWKEIYSNCRSVFDSLSRIGNSADDYLIKFQ